MTSPTAPVISATGITAPTYAQILSYLQTQYQMIFGSDVILTNDSQDGQLLAVFAQAISDANSACIAVYNSFSPTTAQGVGLSSVVAINGLQRLEGSNSTATITVNGTAGITITNGVVGDPSNFTWSLPTSVTIGSGGFTAGVLVTCTTEGAITTGGTINSIQTPVYGWTSISAPVQTATGAGVETDAALRIRQAASVTLPALTIFDGILASIAQIAGVTQYVGYENNLFITNSLGIPATNLCFIVYYGGTNSTIALEVATAITQKIPPGIPTYGIPASGTIVTQTITDLYGSTRQVTFNNPSTSNTLVVSLTLNENLNGWSATTKPVISAAILTYIGSLAIGATISYFNLGTAATLPGTPYFETFSITAMTMQLNGGAIVTTDITQNFNALLLAANVTVNISP